MWNSYLASFCSSTLHPPKILSDTTRWPARQRGRELRLYSFILIYNAVTVYWLLIKNYREGEGYNASL